MEAMGESRRNPEHLEILTGKLGPVPLAEGRRSWTQIDRNVENLTADHPHQLALSMGLDLIVKASKNILSRVRMIILHEASGNAQLAQRSLVVALKKEPAIVTEDLCFQKQHARERGGCNFHGQSGNLRCRSHLKTPFRAATAAGNGRSRCSSWP